MLVRGRVRSDLEAFAERAGIRKSEVYEDETADYPYRLEVLDRAVSRVLTEAVEAMDYNNFKSRVERTQGLDRELVYTGVWAHLRSNLG